MWYWYYKNCDYVKMNRIRLIREKSDLSFSSKTVSGGFFAAFGDGF